MITLDGSTYSGSGTIIRYGVVLATLLKKPLEVLRVRSKRPKPGLRPQHVQALLACCDLCGGKAHGIHVGSETIRYEPGERIRSGTFSWNIGTAGSAVMLALTVLPIAVFSRQICQFTIEGGLFQDFAPTAFHMQQILLPLLERMGVCAEMEILRPGYVPKGEGRLRMTVKPGVLPLKPLKMTEQGKVIHLRCTALASHLQKERVAERMGRSCEELLKKAGFEAEIEVHDDTSAVQKGAALMIRAETDTACLLGADQAGRPGRRSEDIARFTVSSILEDLDRGATTDRHTADQLILFAALARGHTEYLVPQITEHIQSNLWLVREILGARTQLNGNCLHIEGIGLNPTN